MARAPLGRRLGWGRLLIVPYFVLATAIFLKDDTTDELRRVETQQWCEAKVEEHLHRSKQG
jgi:hypothetical protein